MQDNYSDNDDFDFADHYDFNDSLPPKSNVGGSVAAPPARSSVHQSSAPKSYLPDNKGETKFSDGSGLDFGGAPQSSHQKLQEEGGPHSNIGNSQGHLKFPALGNPISPHKTSQQKVLPSYQQDSFSRGGLSRGAGDVLSIRESMDNMVKTDSAINLNQKTTGSQLPAHVDIKSDEGLSKDLNDRTMGSERAGPDGVVRQTSAFVETNLIRQSINSDRSQFQVDPKQALKAPQMPVKEEDQQNENDSDADGDDYEEDEFDEDFNEEEEEELRKTATEFAQKLAAIRESHDFKQYDIAEGGHDVKKFNPTAAAFSHVGKSQHSAIPRLSQNSVSRVSQNHQVQPPAILIQSQNNSKKAPSIALSGSNNVKGSAQFSKKSASQQRQSQQNLSLPRQSQSSAGIDRSSKGTNSRQAVSAVRTSSKLQPPSTILDRPVDSQKSMRNDSGRPTPEELQQMVEQVTPQRKTNKMQSVKNNSIEIQDDALRSPTMLKNSVDGGRKISPDNMSQNDPRNPFRFIEAALTEAKQKIEKMKSTPQILEQLPDEEKKKKYLKAENKLLRENLKRMSDNVNVLIEKMNQESQRKKPGVHGGVGGLAAARSRKSLDGPGQSVTAGDNQSVGAGRSVRGGVQNSPVGTRSNISGFNRERNNQIGERELQNADKAIVNLMKEHNKLKKRLELIQQPDFLINLKRDLKTTEEEIKQQEKLKRQLRVDQLRREKKLDHMVDHSEPDILKQVQDTTQRLAFLTEKLAKLEEENRKAEILRNQQIDQLGELRERLEKLNKIAEHYGVSIEKSKENMAEHKKLTEQLEHLNKQKRILTQAIDTQTRKQEALTAEKRRDLEQLQMRKGEILAKYNERVVELREKGIQIRDLIERAKTEADDGLQEILEKWQHANDRILEKYPEGSQMSFAQLEEAAKDQINAEKNASSKTAKQAKPVSNQGQRDDEMHLYLSEIRVMQEQLLGKMQLDKKQSILEEQKEKIKEESETGDNDSSSAHQTREAQPEPRKAPTKDVQIKTKKGTKKGPTASVRRSTVKAPDSTNEELARLKQELEQEKAEKQRLAQDLIESKRQEEADRKRANEEAEQERQKIRQQEEEVRLDRKREQDEREAADRKVAQDKVTQERQAKEEQARRDQAAAQEAADRQKAEDEARIARERDEQEKRAQAAEEQRQQEEAERQRIADEEEEKRKKAAVGSKPNFGSKPKLGGAAKQGEDNLEGGQEVPVRDSQGSLGSSKPMTFLDRARLAKKQDAPAANNASVESTRALNEIAQQNNAARRDSIERKTDNSYSDFQNESSVKQSSEQVVTSMKVPDVLKSEDAQKEQPSAAASGGYQPSGFSRPSVGGGVYQPSTGSGYQPSTNQPRRRRQGEEDSQPEILDTQTSQPSNRPRMQGPPSGDPFAKFDTYDPLKNQNNANSAAGSNMLIRPSYNQPSTIQQQAEPQSFTSKLIGESAKPAAVEGGPEIKQSIGSIRGPAKRPAMKMNVSSNAPKPAVNRNLVADLDDLEDLN